MSQQWRRIPERGTLTALTLIRWIGVRVGRWAGRLLLYPITFYFLLTAVSPRRGSLIYLRRVLDRQPTWVNVFRHIHCFAATILDRVYLLAGEFDRFDVRIHDGQFVIDQVESGRGCILLGSHLGSFEILRVLGVTRRHFPLKVLMNVGHNQGMSRFMDALNPEIAATIIPIQGPETLLKVKESLEHGYLIGTLGDRVVANDKTIRCRFLGAETNFPAGPWLLATMMKCPVILFFGLYRGGNRYDVHFERLTERVGGDRQHRQADIQQWAQRYAERLEHYTRDAPYNWFNFYDFWRDP